MDDDLELNGIEFVEVAEHLVERMKRLPEPTLDDSLHIPPPGRESRSTRGRGSTYGSGRGSGGGSLSGSPRSGSPLRGFGMKTLAPVEGAVCLIEADPQRLLSYVRTMSTEHCPPPESIEVEDMPYWRRVAAGMITRELENDSDDGDDNSDDGGDGFSSVISSAADDALAVDGNGRGNGDGDGNGNGVGGEGNGKEGEGEGEGRGSRSSSAVGRKKHGCFHCCTTAQLGLRSYFTHFATMHETVMMLVSFANIWVLTLYAHAHG